MVAQNKKAAQWRVKFSQGYWQPRQELHVIEQVTGETNEVGGQSLCMFQNTLEVRSPDGSDEVDIGKMENRNAVPGGSQPRDHEFPFVDLELENLVARQPSHPAVRPHAHRRGAQFLSEVAAQ